MHLYIISRMDSATASVVEGAARAAAGSAGAPLLLAVSGGLDSMALLVAMSRAAPAAVAGVATFDHGTGSVATAASAHVARAALALGIPVVQGCAGAETRAPDGREAAWRSARHAFLMACAREVGARMATAHTEDDQVETVLLRLMRGSGTRGLAALEATSPVVRPFLAVRRAVLARYAAERGVRWVEDPGNGSAAHLRNRVRHDLLPALRRANETIDDVLLATGRAAARWRREVDALVEERLSPTARLDGGVEVGRAELAGMGADSLAVVWGALAHRAGLALDWRGTERLSSFIMQGATRGAVPVSGGWRVEARSDAYVLSRVPMIAAEASLPRHGVVRWGEFRFRVGSAAASQARDDAWSAWIDDAVVARVRAWRAGDRLGGAGGHSRRRVARYLSEAGLHGADRAAWPVVVAGDDEDAVWIPGVRRSDAATERSGRPVRHYACERIGR